MTEAGPPAGSQSAARPRRRILVIARHIALDRTSEGLCTARMIGALEVAGHDVRCVTSESGLPGAPWTGAAEIIRVPALSGWWKRPLARILDPDRPGPRWWKRLRWFFALAVTLLTGHKPRALSELDAWRRALRENLRQFEPDLVIVRGGGTAFEAHLALAGAPRPGPWIAHYHDPYPVSAYPPSYAHRTPIISARDERGNRRILTAATMVTFPSRRLAAWTERSSGVGLAGRVAVVPHIGGALTDEPPDHPLVDHLWGDRPFLLVHTGTLLGQRPLEPLLRAYARLLDSGELDRNVARLVLLGRVDRQHRADEDLASLRNALEEDGSLRVHDGRSSHATALALVSRATAAVVIEAPDPESPFFPAKLADYLAAGLPVIALSPAESVATDLLGPHHPLWAPPDDEEAILAVLQHLVHAWRTSGTDPLCPSAQVQASVAATAVRDDLGEVVERALHASATSWAPG